MTSSSTTLGSGLGTPADSIGIVASILKLAGPTVVVLMIQIAIGIAETYYVGRLGTNALAGAALVAPLVALMTMMSNGGIGGGVAAAVARTLGAGHRSDADALATQAVWLGLAFGVLFSLGALIAGPAIYSALGGRGPALTAALTYGGAVFASAVPNWILNLLSASLRGAGDVKTPAAITLGGAVLVIPLSPLLIFGLGPSPAFGIAGAGIAVGIYYVGACAVLIARMRRPTSALVLRFHLPRLDLLRRIMRVGGLSALGSISLNITTILVTGAVGLFGSDALAGYGVAARLDFLLIPLLFGLGSAVTTLVGRSIGGGDPRRSKRTAWTGAVLAVIVTETIGLLVAAQPQAWMGLFTHSPDVIAIGSHYLRIVAPAYGFVGLSMTLYFASQGAGRIFWPFAIGLLRLAVAAGGAWLAVKFAHADFSGVAIAVALGSATFGCGCALAVRLSDWGARSASGKR
jgi:putative MATE family efflux protein